MIQYFAKELEKIAMLPTTTVPKVHTTSESILSQSGASVKLGKNLGPTAKPLPGGMSGSGRVVNGLQTKVNPVGKIKTVPPATATTGGSLVR